LLERSSLPFASPQTPKIPPHFDQPVQIKQGNWVGTLLFTVDNWGSEYYVHIHWSMANGEQKGPKKFVFIITTSLNMLKNDLQIW
jgi:hypothetical protein